MPLTRRLYIVRHAKSSWDDPGLDDHERPLAPRGRHAVELMAEHLRAEAIRPALVLCSSARRTRETLAGLCLEAEAVIEPELYGASALEVLARLRRVAPAAQSVMVIGHNPAMRELVVGLAEAEGKRQRAELAALAAKFPTGAMATLCFDCPWPELRPGQARLTAFVRPRSLPRDSGLS